MADALRADFSTVPDGQVPTVADTGQSFGLFSGPARVSGGYFDSEPGSGASYLEADAEVWPIDTIGARWRFNSDGGTLTTSGTLALITWADGGIVANGFGRRTSCHVTITATGVQWYVRDTENGGTVTLLSTKTISPPLAADVDHTATVTIGSGTGTVVIDGGTPYTWSDPRIAQYEGEVYACYEPYYEHDGTDTRAEIAQVWADGQPVPVDVTPALTGAEYIRNAAPIGSLGVTIPSTASVDDLLILAAEWLNSTVALTDPAGWTRVGTSARTGISTALWIRTAVTGDPGSTATVVADTAAPANVACWSVSNIDAVGSVQSANQGSGSHSITVPSFTPSVGVVPMHVLILARSSDAAAVLTPPSGMTPLADNLPDAATRMGMQLAAATDWADDTAVGNVWTNTDNHYAVTFLMPVTPAVPEVPAEGSATGAIVWTGQATGSAPAVPAHSGAATGSIAWQGSATGSTPAVPGHTGSASGTIVWTGTAIGTAPTVPDHSGSASDTITWTGTAAGERRSTGTATGGITWTGIATGGTPTTRIDITVIASGTRVRTLATAGATRADGITADPTRTDWSADDTRTQRGP